MSTSPGNNSHRTGLILDDRFSDHLTTPGHPESPDRIKALSEYLPECAIWDQLVHLPTNPTSINNLKLVHPQEYIKLIENSCGSGFSYLDGGDTVVSEKSYNTGLLAVGGLLTAVDEIMADKISNAFCAVRPPGHHAEVSTSMGFCLFNNVAIAARYLQNKYQLNRILILDWDVHHGNGTQHIFDEDPNVFYISLHQFPLFPGTGSGDETGHGDGLGATVNFPLVRDGGNSIYLDLIENKISEIVGKFHPEFIIISAGFDAHIDDPLAQMNVETGCFGEMTKIMVKLAEENCDGKLLSVLEGGYNLHALKMCVESHLTELHQQ